MDFADQLAAITSKCHLVQSSDQAVHIAPDLCVDAPSLWDLGEEGAATGYRWVFPVACTSRLAQPVAEVVAKTLASALNDEDRESFAGMSATDWAADPLAATLTRLLLEASLVSSRATGLPLLEVARIASGLLAGSPPGAAARGASASEIERNLPRLAEQLPVRQGEILSQVAWSLSARIGAAFGLATQVAPSLRPTRFYQAMLRSKLSLVVRADGTLPELSFLLGALDISGDPVLLAKLLLVCEAGLTAIDARMRDGKGTAKDRQFSAGVLTRACIGSSTEQRSWLLAHDPDVASAFLLQLADFSNAKQLGAQGIDRKQAKQLLDPELAQAVAATLAEVLRATQLWDLLGGMIALVQRSEDIQVPSWQKGYRSRLVVPRGDLGETKAFVVAARLGDVQAKTFQEARTSDDAVVPFALEAHLTSLQAELESMGAAVYSTGSHLVGLAPSATTALAIGEKIREVATPPYGLEFGSLRQPTSIPRGPAIGVGLAHGAVHGGFDGEGQALRGPAIQQALGLTGIDSPHGALGDPLGLRHVALGAAGLLSKGIVASPAFVEHLEAESNRQGRRFVLPDSGQPVAGVRKPFVAYPVAGVREGSDRTVTLLLRLDGDSSSSPVEIIRMGIDSFQEFHGQDQGLQPGSCRGLTAGGGGLYPPAAPATPASAPAGDTGPTATSSMLSDPFGSEVGSLPPMEGSDFDYDEEDEEYEFEIEEVPFTPPEPEDDPDEDDGFALDDLEVSDFEEGVLVLEDAPALESADHPLDSLTNPAGFELGGDSGEGSPFAFDSDSAFSDDALDSSGEDDLFSFDEIGDDEDDPFAPATASNPASISLSGETSLDAWDTAPIDEQPSDPSEAGEQTDDEALLGFLPPAEPTDDAESPRAESAPTAPADPAPTEPAPSAPAEDEPAPLGYLPPAPTDEPGASAEVHEVRLPSRAAARPANPTLLPEAPQATPQAPAPPSRSPHTDKPPEMPSSLLALLGDDPPELDSPAPGGASFQVIEPEPEATREPELEMPTLEVEAPAEPTTPDEDDDEDDPWGPDMLESDDSLAFEGPPTDDPASPGAELGSPFDTVDEAPADPPAPPSVPAPSAAQFASPPLDDDLPDDPLANGDDDDAFESLFSDDPDDEALDLDLSEILDDVPTAIADKEPPPEPTPDAASGVEQEAPVVAEAEPEQEPAEPDQPEPDQPEPDQPDEPDQPEPDQPEPDQPEPDQPEPDQPEPDDEPESEQPDEEPAPFEEPASLDLEDPSEDLEPDPFEHLDDGAEQGEEPAPVASPGRGADGAKKVRRGNRSRTMPDFAFMFTGYHIYITEKNTVLFGHRYGSLLLDVHEYPCGDDVPTAYLRFLEDKVSERFIPRSDLSRPVPKQLDGNPLDIQLLQDAFTNLRED